jgi:hypothetical protein
MKTEVMKSLWDSHGGEHKAYKAGVSWGDSSSQKVDVVFELPEDFYSRITQTEVGSIREEIWKSDCLEVFVFFRDGSYREWNLATDLAWWNCRFTSYRKATADSCSEEFKPMQFSLDSASRRIQWQMDCGKSAYEITRWRACVVDKKMPEPHLLSSDKLAAEGRDFHLVSA